MAEYTIRETTDGPGDYRLEVMEMVPRTGGSGKHKSAVVSVAFDSIEATGYGYWVLRRDGETVAQVNDLGAFDSGTVQDFRDVQFGEDE